ncbi:MAG: tetratricopeptide repeat protein, partial [Peptostreptococcaceae bacterium]
MGFINQEKLKREIKYYDNTVIEKQLKEYDMNDIIKYLKSKNKLAEISFIEGYHLLEQNKLDEAYYKFILSLSQINSSTQYLTKVYTYKYLSVIDIKKENYDEAKKNILNSFNSIDEKYYNEAINVIIRMAEMCQQTKELRYTVIDILKEVIESEIITDESKLQILDELSLLYFINNEYANSSEANLEYIILSKEMGKDIEYAKGLIYLATLFNELKGNVTAVATIEEALRVEIKDKKERGKIQSYGYLNLGEIYADMGMYIEALNSVEKVKQFKDYYSEEDYRDFEILVNLVKAKCYINLNELEEANKLIEKSRELLEKDKDLYFINKEIEYGIVEGEYFFAKREYKNAIKIYKEVLQQV